MNVGFYRQKTKRFYASMPERDRAIFAIILD